MGKTLNEIAQELRDATYKTNRTEDKTVYDKKGNKEHVKIQKANELPVKVQLIYAFNGVGKTRLSRELKQLIIHNDKQREEESKIKVLYYNAFTEDLFYWDNDLDEDTNRKVIIRPNGFTNLAFGFLKDQGQDANIATHFQRYTNNKLTPLFSENFDEITFTFAGGNEEIIRNVKISKGEESNLIWCIFFSLIEQVVDTLNEEDTTNRSTQDFNQLEYVFIDDPVSSLDDNHLIELAVDIAELIKTSQSNIKFIITTHNPLFYNVLYNQFRSSKSTQKKYLEKLSDGTFKLCDIGDSPFAYHISLLSELEKLKKARNVKKFHFNLLRNILEKTSTFLGYKNWKELLPDNERKEYYNRIINLYSHSKHHGEEITIIQEDEKDVLFEILDILQTTYHIQIKGE